MAEAKPTDVVVPTSADGIRDLLTRAANGDASTAPAVRKLMEKPGTIELIGGNLAWQVQSSFVNAIAGKDVAVREAIHAKLANLRKELLGNNPTPVEVLLVERVAACWLHVQDAELRSAQAKDLSIRQADYQQRRMDATNRRYLAAVKALATVRKLALPAVQINVAKKQVNVMATGDK